MGLLSLATDNDPFTNPGWPGVPAKVSTEKAFTSEFVLKNTLRSVSLLVSLTRRPFLEPSQRRPLGPLNSALEAKGESSIPLTYRELLPASSVTTPLVSIVLME